MAKTMRRHSSSLRRSYRRSSKRSRCKGSKHLMCLAKPNCKYVKTKKHSFCRKIKNRRHRQTSRK